MCHLKTPEASRQGPLAVCAHTRVHVCVGGVRERSQQDEGSRHAGWCQQNPGLGAAESRQEQKAGGPRVIRPCLCQSLPGHVWQDQGCGKADTLAARVRPQEAPRAGAAWDKTLNHPGSLGLPEGERVM